MMHITGGAFTKLKSLLKNSDVLIKRDHKMKPQKIFLELYERGISSKNMYQTFNCGVGFIFSTSQKSAKEIILRSPDMDIIGSVVDGTGKIKINSMFDGGTVVF